MLVIVDYGMGNVASIANMMKYVGVTVQISSDFSIISKADKLILPGVGAFDHGMKNLHQKDLLSILNESVIERKVPTLGICLGMQLMTQRSEEGLLPGLGWIDAETIKFKFSCEQNKLKIPHMGWNNVKVCKNTRLFKNSDLEQRFYFVHSYHVVCKNTGDILAKTFHGYEFVSAIEYDNIVGVQFHPEKSHKFGMNFLRNWALLSYPAC